MCTTYCESADVIAENRVDRGYMSTTLNTHFVLQLKYCKVSNIRRIKSQNRNTSRPIL